MPTKEEVDREYEEHPTATPLEHVWNLLFGNENNDDEEAEQDKSEKGQGIAELLFAIIIVYLLCAALFGWWPLHNWPW